MPLSRLQYFGGAQECRWQATSPRDGRLDRGSASSLLGVAGVVPCVLLDLLHPEATSARQRTASAMGRVPRIWDR